MPTVIFQLCAGLLILLASTQYLIKAAEKISLSLKISPLLIGMTLVAIGTSLPELALSTTAAIKGDHGLAIGNIIGSNIVNTLFILPVGILVGSIRVGTAKTQRNALILMTSTLTFVVLHLLGINLILSAIILFTVGVGISFLQYYFAKKAAIHEDKKMFSKQKKIQIELLSLLLILPTIIGIIAGSFLTVMSLEEISFRTGITTTILGLSLSALATSLPELLITIFSQQQHQDKLTLGNILGSNIYNLTLIGSIVLFVSRKNVLPPSDFIFLLLSTLALGIILVFYKGKTLPKIIGVIGLLCYGSYLVYLAK